MFRRAVAAVFILAASAVLAGPSSAAANGATVYDFQFSTTGTYNWWNPCLDEAVVVDALAEVEGRVVLDPAGGYHSFVKEFLVEGEDTNGWTITKGFANRHQEGGDWPPDALLWQLHLTLEDPVTGAAYSGVHTFHGQTRADGTLVVFKTNAEGFACLRQNWLA